MRSPLLLVPHFRGLLFTEGLMRRDFTSGNQWTATHSGSQESPPDLMQISGLTKNIRQRTTDPVPIVKHSGSRPLRRWWCYGPVPA
ncbi:hypothetical protein TNCV_2758491 [Trichonephila clavipes]|nr:hypothetical protein TNCV_2758491 [Trichonephila clavipes]